MGESKKPIETLSCQMQPEVCFTYYENNAASISPACPQFAKNNSYLNHGRQPPMAPRHASLTRKRGNVFQGLLLLTDIQQCREQAKTSLVIRQGVRP
jgi:hypothetical protein